MFKHPKVQNPNENENHFLRGEDAGELGHNTRIIADVCHAEDVVDEWRKGQGAKWAP